MMAVFLLLVVGFALLVDALPSSNVTGRPTATTRTRSWCKRGQFCWPSPAELEELSAALDPSAKRVLYWAGQPHPRVCSVPIYSPDDQPLYGWAKNGMKPLYYADEPISSLCFLSPGESRPVCLAGLRNNPQEDWHPAIVVWPLTAEHVQTAVRFAVAHNLCIMVAGTGHDFMNRHSCDEGMFIRTTLMKDIEWDLIDKKRFGHADGNVRLGAGIVFSEAQKSAADHGRYMSAGWAITVGIVGWSTGGGHGPFAPSSGLGVDNILEVEIVTADGNLVVANANQNSDLFWSVRGGGGSTWGVITALTLKAHINPYGSFLMGQGIWFGSMCSAGREKLHVLIDAYLNWSLALDKRWSGLAFFTPSPSSDEQCGGNWTIFTQYVFLGTDKEGEAVWSELTEKYPPDQQGGRVTATWWEQVEVYPLENIIPLPFLPPSEKSVGSVPSVLVGREEVAGGVLAAQIKNRLDDCIAYGVCSRQELYHDITGNTDSPQDPAVSISPGFRKAMMHFVVGQWNASVMESYYQLGENSYFSESAYEIPGESWKQRYWGVNYAELLKTKQKYDPQGAFWCRHCVGSDL